MKTATCKRCSVVFEFDGRWRHFCPTCKVLQTQEVEQNWKKNHKKKTEIYSKIGRQFEHLCIRSRIEVGEILGISDETVRQVEMRALAKIRAGLEALGVKSV